MSSCLWADRLLYNPFTDCRALSARKPAAAADVCFHPTQHRVTPTVVYISPPPPPNRFDRFSFRWFCAPPSPASKVAGRYDGPRPPEKPSAQTSAQPCASWGGPAVTGASGLVFGNGTLHCEHLGSCVGSGVPSAPVRSCWPVKGGHRSIRAPTQPNMTEDYGRKAAVWINIAHKTRGSNMSESPTLSSNYITNGCLKCFRRRGWTVCWHLHLHCSVQKSHLPKKVYFL